MNHSTIKNIFNTMPPEVDYSGHPAFSEYINSSSKWDESRIERHINTIDYEYHSILKEKYISEDRLIEQIDSKLITSINEIKKYLLEEIDSENYNWIEKSLDTVKNVLKDNLVCEFRKQDYQTSDRKRKYINKTKEMQENGYAIFDFSEKLLKQLEGGCAAQLTSLRAQILAKPESRAATSIPLNGKFGRALRKIVKNYGVEMVASDYKKCKMTLLYAALDLSVPSQNWYKDCYEDVKLGTSQTVTMHYDYDVPVLKAMIYLNKVDEYNGATGIIPGSHLWERSPFLFAFVNELDHQYPNVFGSKKQNENYYRPRFKQLEDRQRFANMPKIIQGTSHFGDDVIDGSPLSNYLITNERRFISDRPQCMLFDGAQAIHRGGIVTKNERIAIQIAFHPQNSDTYLKKLFRKLNNIFKFLFK